MDGGGLHQTLRGGHLNIHADFTTHHVHEHWARRVNILLYLNEEWHDDWGGRLELWDRDMTACQGPRHAPGQPDAGLHDVVRQLPRPPGRPDLPARRGPPFDGAVLLHRGGDARTPRRRTTARARRRVAYVVPLIAADRVALDLYDRTQAEARHQRRCRSASARHASTPGAGEPGSRPARVSPISASHGARWRRGPMRERSRADASDDHEPHLQPQPVRYAVVEVAPGGSRVASSLTRRSRRRSATQADHDRASSAPPRCAPHHDHPA